MKLWSLCKFSFKIEKYCRNYQFPCIFVFILKIFPPGSGSPTLVGGRDMPSVLLCLGGFCFLGWPAMRWHNPSEPVFLILFSLPYLCWVADLIHRNGSQFLLFPLFQLAYQTGTALHLPANPRLSNLPHYL